MQSIPMMVPQKFLADMLNDPLGSRKVYNYIAMDGICNADKELERSSLMECALRKSSEN